MTRHAASLAPPPRQALLDANLWFSIVKTDVFMEAYARDLLQLRWTTQIAKEWIRNVTQQKRTSRKKARSRYATMCSFVDGWQILHYGHLAKRFPAVDVKDRHVIAAAQKCGERVRIISSLNYRKYKIFSKISVDRYFN